MSLVRKTVLHNKMGLDIIAPQRGTYAIIQTECCVFIADESAHAPSLLNHVRTQVNALSQLIPSLGDLVISGSDHGTLGRKNGYLYWESLS